MSFVLPPKTAYDILEPNRVKQNMKILFRRCIRVTEMTDFPQRQIPVITFISSDPMNGWIRLIYNSHLTMKEGGMLID